MNQQLYNKGPEKLNAAISMLIILGILCAFILLFMQSCTYNVSMVHSEGTSSDAIDTDQKTDPEITTTIPIKPI
jgi:hypothetical protein